MHLYDIFPFLGVAGIVLIIWLIWKWILSSERAYKEKEEKQRREEFQPFLDEANRIGNTLEYKDTLTSVIKYINDCINLDYRYNKEWSIWLCNEFIKSQSNLIDFEYRFSLRGFRVDNIKVFAFKMKQDLNDYYASR